jgi:hypothetical protein
MDRRFLDLDTRRPVVSFTALQFFPYGKSPWYVLGKDLCGPLTGLDCVEIIVLSLPRCVRVSVTGYS